MCSIGFLALKFEWRWFLPGVSTVHYCIVILFILAWREGRQAYFIKFSLLAFIEILFR